jgi:hypothetical protein
MRSFLIFAALATTAAAHAQTRFVAPLSQDAPLTDYCTLAALPPESCQSGFNYGAAADCPRHFRAVAVSCFISQLVYPLDVNAVKGSRGVCGWFLGHPPGPQVLARASVLCLADPSPHSSRRR